MYVIHTSKDANPAYVDIHTVMSNKLKTFPRFFINKRYKLITFAPNVDIVDKQCFNLKHNNKHYE